jgi:DNA invertase Pin-like site-specific DNA recombinase
MSAVVGYGRVSTASGEQLSALDAQLHWLRSQSCTLVLHDVESGLNVDRPAYNDLLRLITAGTVTTLWATRADRLGRDAPELVRLVQACDRHGVRVCTRDDGELSSRTAEDLLMLFLRAALAQGESMKIAARVNRGLEEGRRMGKPMRKPCWPYRLSQDRTTLEPDQEQWPVALRFVDHLRDHQWRTHQALQSFADPIPLSSCRAVRAWLLNPCVRGGIGYQQGSNHTYHQVVWDRHPAVLSHGDFQAYQVAAASNRRRWGVNSKRRTRALTSLLVCRECGWRLKYITGRTIPALRCGGQGCSQCYRGVRESEVIRWSFEQIAQQAAHHLAAIATQDEPPEVGELRRQIEQLERLQDPDLQDAIKQKRQRLEQLLAQPATDEALLAAVSDPEWHQAATYEEQTAMLQQLVREVQIEQQQPVAIALRL